MAFSYFFNRTRKFWFHFGSLLDPHMNIYQSGFNISENIRLHVFVSVIEKQICEKRFDLEHFYRDTEPFFSSVPPFPIPVVLPVEV